MKIVFKVSDDPVIEQAAMELKSAVERLNAREKWLIEQRRALREESLKVNREQWKKIHDRLREIGKSPVELELGHPEHSHLYLDDDCENILLLKYVNPLARIFGGG